jgi:S-adenosylmethionine decarboxylase
LTAGGQHLLVEFRGCSFDKLNDPNFVEQTLIAAAKKADATILHYYTHKFDPQGVTSFVALSESHISIHCWPECGYAAIDVFLCGKLEPLKALEALVDNLEPESFDTKMLQRN